MLFKKLLRVCVDKMLPFLRMYNKLHLFSLFYSLVSGMQKCVDKFFQTLARVASTEQWKIFTRQIKKHRAIVGGRISEGGVFLF